MKKSLLPLLLAFVITATVRHARAEPLADTPENRREQAVRYLEATPSNEKMADIAKVLAASLPAAQREKITRIFSNDSHTVALKKAMNDSLVKIFTADELKALADFYSSPAGKSAMSKMSAYMLDLMPVVRAQVHEAIQSDSQSP